jgi:hypothetical protein
MAALSSQFDPVKLAASLQQDDDGFSVDPRTGQSPSSGFAVSRFGHRVIDSAPPPAETVADAAQSVLPGQYLGAWVDGGKTYLDSSRNIQSRTEAMEFGKRNAQIAVYDINQGGSERVEHTPPMSASGTLFEQLPSREFDQLNADNNEGVRLRTERKLGQQEQVRKSPTMLEQLRRQGAGRRGETEDGKRWTQPSI